MANVYIVLMGVVFNAGKKDATLKEGKILLQSDGLKYTIVTLS